MFSVNKMVLLVKNNYVAIKELTGQSCQATTQLKNYIKGKIGANHVLQKIESKFRNVTGVFHNKITKMTQRLRAFPTKLISKMNIFKFNFGKKIT